MRVPIALITSGQRPASIFHNNAIERIDVHDEWYGNVCKALLLRMHSTHPDRVHGCVAQFAKVARTLRLFKQAQTLWYALRSLRPPTVRHGMPSTQCINMHVVNGIVSVHAMRGRDRPVPVPVSTAAVRSERGLTNEEINEIRQVLSTSYKRGVCAELARIYNVSKSAISNIKTGRKHCASTGHDRMQNKARAAKA